MFDSFRDKLYSFQENLSTSLRGLTVNDSLNKKQVVQSVNLNAGIDLLEQFQSSWSELHEASQENVLKAQNVDKIISDLHKHSDKQWKDINQLATIIASLPEVIHSLNNVCGKVVAMEELFDNVEKALIHLEDLIETREFQNKQLEQRFQLALQNEKNLVMLENVRVSLSKEHAEKVKEHEAKQMRLLKECQEASEENFKKDLQHYKETNTLPKIEFAKRKTTGSGENEATSLEDVILETEEPGTLEEFLNDSNDTGKK